MADQRSLIAQVGQTVRIYNLLVMVVGAVILVTSINRSHDDALSKSLEVVGTALVSAALVSFIFGQITIRDTTLQVDQAIDRALREVLQPVRENLFAGALARYRWDCHLDRLGPDGYATQAIRISYQDPEMPRELRFICVSSPSDEPFGALSRDSRYVFRWRVNEGSGPINVDSFRVYQVCVDGEQLRQAPARQTTLRGVPAIEFKFPLPESRLRYGMHSVEFRVVTRKRLGADRKIRVLAHVFRPVLDAEYRLAVGESVGAQALSTHVSGVSRLGAGGLTQHGCMHPASFGHAAAYAIFATPLQVGSSIAFTIDREIHGGGMP
ncbi:hypothetical protein [Streptomyces chartreusis]|uniref:hypothetical protein n=1 Tax=Streptomyces chartreusis TaxID=1969 RepID=UPI00366528D3